jgi:hypothetical protein
MKHILLFLSFCLLTLLHAPAQQYISEVKKTGSFTLSNAQTSASIYVDKKDYPLVQKAAIFLQQDIEKVTGKKPSVLNTVSSNSPLVIIGSIDQSTTIQQLVKENKLNIDKIRGQWEAYQVSVVRNPFKNVAAALVIAGSDRRGTAYGVFDLSQQIGVSPWYWWADVPVKKKKELYFNTTATITDAPKVKYRGIFINDEAPALSGWTKEKFGGVNHEFYEKVFELILRLKGNYLWPAMWANAFNDDDKLNPVLADEYGIVMGTSHHEPMLRAQQEWKRFGKGKWDYDSNEVVLKNFWKKGIENMGNHESIVTVGMRGDGDEPMTRGTATALLERIVKDQRQILEEVTKKPASETPQLWALYKEVQDYYDKGMRVPDDVTLLLCDDNWGNIRKLPKLTDPKRKGGYGIYYHFDYVGGPRNYKWLNTNNLARVWEQMHLAYEYNVRDIWIVNVGDIKPMELPISFFLDYAWNPNRWNEDNLRGYYKDWASKQFSTVHANEIGNILLNYAQYSSRRKPELLDANTYSLSAYNEADRVLKEWNDLLARAESINNHLPSEQRDAYFQLVLHPIKAMANLHELYSAVAKNKVYAGMNARAANQYADKAKQFYLNDSLINKHYHQIANGKWNHMMSQTHIGYTYWQQPPVNKMPAVRYVSKDALVEIDTVIARTNVPSAITLIPKPVKGNIFYEQNGYVSIEAEHWTKALSATNIKWKVIPDIGKTGSGVTTFPVTVSSSLTATSPQLQYEFYTYDTGRFSASLHFSPTLNFHNNEGLQFAVSIDNEQPQVITLNKDDNTRSWDRWVANNIIIKSSTHTIATKGRHVLKYWMISPAVVLQKIVLDFGNAKQSYLGPPETKMK